LKPDVWGLDDNFSRAGDAATLVADPVTRAHLAGIAFHCYKGAPADMQQFRDAHPDVPVAISECTSGGWADTFRHALTWDVRNLLIGGVETVAFANRDGSHVLPATNAAREQASFRLRADEGWFRYTLPAGAVATFTW